MHGPFGRILYNIISDGKEKDSNSPLIPRLHLRHLIVFEDDSQATMHIGNWSDYEAMMQENFGKDLTPHRVKYRTLKR